MISEEEYKKILEREDKGELLLYINTSGFRRVFTSLGSEIDEEKLSKDIEEDLKFRSLIIKIIAFVLEPLFFISASIISVFLFSWYSFAIIPLLLAFLVFVQGKASYKRQEILSPILFLILSIISFFLFPDLSLLLRIFIINVCLMYLLPKLLYYLTARFTHHLLQTNYKFFRLFYDQDFYYETKSDYNAPKVWYRELKEESKK